MPGLVAVGDFSYNGYTFDGTVKTEITVTPELDEAGRTNVFQKITIEADAIVAPGGGDTSDAEMDDIRRRLCENGGELVFSNKGFSKPLKVNVGKVRDVAWGPKVEMLSWKPIGSAQACQIKWRVTTCIPCCASARYEGVMAINYQASYAINERGATTRTITGYLQIAQTRKGHKVPDSADQYRQFFAPKAPLGFSRTQNWAVDKSKSRVDFTITDRENETPNAFPPGVVKISAEHSVNWSFGTRTGLQPRSRISMQIERAHKVPGMISWLIFLAFVNARRVAAKSITNSPVLLESLHANEQVFGYTSSFSATYRHLGAIYNIAQGAGLWTPIGTDWNQWRLSLASSMFNDSGTAGLRSFAGEDAIIDLCEAPSFPLGIEAKTDKPSTQFYPGLQNQYPQPKYSWLKYTAMLIPHFDSGIAILRPLQASPGDTQQPLTSASEGDYVSQPPKAIPDVLQSSGGSYKVGFVGTAERAGFTIPRPRLLKIGSQDAILLSDTFACREKANALGVPVYEATWDQMYALANAPGKLPPAPRIDEAFKK